MKLSEELLNWRIDRPDEWKMDEFVRKAVALEKELELVQTLQANKDFLQWIYDRLIYVHRESSSVDYMHKFREIIEATQ